MPAALAKHAPDEITTVATFKKSQMCATQQQTAARKKLAKASCRLDWEDPREAVGVVKRRNMRYQRCNTRSQWERTIARVFPAHSFCVMLLRITDRADDVYGDPHRASFWKTMQIYGSVILRMSAEGKRMQRLSHH